MPKTRVQKGKEISEFKEGLQGAKAIVFADLSALKVNDTSAFRSLARKESVSVNMTKKTLLRLALKEAGVSTVDVDALKGSISLLFGQGDVVAPAKVLEEFRKTHENIKVLGGLLDDAWMSADQVKALAKLPSRDQLIAQVVGTIRAPLSGLVGVLQGNLRNLVYTLNAIKESK